MSYNDAKISHVKNGIYGSMYFASAISSAFVYDDISLVFRRTMDFIPKSSRLYESID